MDRRTLADLNRAIAAQNPFSGLSELGEPEVWSGACPDCEAVHREAADRVSTALQAAERENRVRSIAILGEEGTGKTHLLARVRRQLRESGCAAFVYADAQQFRDGTTIRQMMLIEVVRSLTQRGASGFMQWQELASFLANQAFQGVEPSAKNLTPDMAVRRLRSQPQDRNRHWIDRVAEAFYKVRPNIDDPDVVRAILWTLAPSQAPFARKWLSAKSLAPWKLDELGLPNAIGDTRESRAGELLQDILRLVADWKPLVVAIDRLEAVDDEEEEAELEIHWDVRVPISAMVQLSQSLRRLRGRFGAVLLSAMEPDTWYRALQPILGSMSRHIIDRGDPACLSEPDERTIEAVVRTWLKQFYAQQDLTPPTALYPFDRAQLTALAREESNFCEVIAWCEENFHPVENDPIERVVQAFERVSDVDRAGESLDERRVAKALAFGFESLVGTTIEDLEIQSIDREVAPKSLNRRAIDFKVVALQREMPISIAVAVVQSDRGVTVGARLRKLCDRETFGFTRGCLVRSRDRDIPRRWKARRELDRLEALGGSRVDLQDIEPLLAVYEVFLQRREWGLSRSRILAFVAQKGLVTQNPTVRGILRSSIEATVEPVTPANDSIEANGDFVGKGGLDRDSGTEFYRSI
ncbi:MAG: AAA family ATPase [Cyanobacteria bacterium SID2]|nr:AAA family ATPase [Cyanobacteria bacterium SID2]MBP0002545.1 AAA family ATPase [Cyanobacteria bacterium SBC]